MIVLERARVVQLRGHVDDRGHALPDRDVDADHVAVLVVDDRVEADRALAGLTIADDQFALAAADVVIESIALMPVSIGSFTGWRCTTPGRLELGRAGLVGVDVALAVERVAERVDDAAEQRLPHGDLEQAAGALDLVALLDLVPLAEEHGADVVRLEVEGQPGHVVRQLQELHRHAVVEPVDARDAVGHGQHGAHLGQVGPAVLDPLDTALEDARDLVRLDLHLVSLRGFRDLFP